MAEAGSGDKTEKPTAQRLRKAREQGHAVRSRDLSAAIGILVSLKLLVLVLPGTLQDFAALFRMTYAPSDNAGAMLDLGAQYASAVMLLLAKMLAPLLVVPFAIVVGSLVPGGWVFNASHWLPQFNRLSPAANLGRLVGGKHYSELAVVILKAGCLGFVLVHVARTMGGDYLALQGMSLDVALPAGAGLMLDGLMTMVGVFVLFALIDAPLQQLFFLRSQRMSKQDLKEEHKSNEGRPEVRQRIRRLQQQLRRRSARQTVPGADVVIVNPEHYAVALKYDEKRAEAPFLLAKGVDEMALYIRALAVEHGVQVLTLPPLARAVYNTSQVHQQIPASLYKPVAQVLSYVMQLQAFRRGARAREPPLPRDLPVPQELT
jgi:flagellar biosynthetic protein FlhB